jgi:glycine oxidase
VKVKCDERQVLLASCKTRHSEVLLTTSSGNVLVPKVIIAAGASTAHLLDEDTFDRAGLPSVFSGRGVSLRCASTVDLPFAVRTPNRGSACGLHVLQNTNSCIYIGATNRLVTDRCFSSGAALGELSGLIGAACSELSVAYSRLEVLSSHVGYRAVTIDYRPLVGATRCEGIMVATGTWRNGVLLAPLIGDLIAAELCDGNPSYARFSPLRRVAPTELSERTLTLYATDVDRWWIENAEYRRSRHCCMSLAALKGKLSEALAVSLKAPASSDAITLARRLWRRAPMREMIPSLLTILTYGDI